MKKPIPATTQAFAGTSASTLFQWAAPFKTRHKSLCSQPAWEGMSCTYPHVVPSKGSLVNLGERKTTSLIGILDMGKVIVEVLFRGQPDDEASLVRNHRVLLW